MQRAKRIVGYARVSSVEQAVGTSLQDQQDVIRSHAQARGLKVETMYVESESAVHEKIERREQIRTLLADVRAGDLVLVDKIDRWSRDPEFSYRSIREILAKGAAFYAVGDACDPSTPEGDTMLNFRVLFAREEHKRIKQRMVGTRNLLRDRGYFASGGTPVGYARQNVRGADKNALVVVDEKAAIVRRVFAMCIGGQSLSEIAEKLEVRRDWVFDVLRNRVYLGEMRNAKGEWIRGRHPPIVDARTFSEAAASLEGRRYGAARSPSVGVRTADWWLRDVARCALCGAKMTSAYGQTQVYFACFAKCTRAYVNVRIAEAQCEPLVAARLVELRDELAKAPPATAAKAPIKDGPVRLEKIARRRARYLEAFADDSMTRAELRAALAKLDAERTKLEAALAPVAAPSSTARREMLASIEAIDGAWSRASAASKRVILRGLARAVKLAAEHHATVEWFTAAEIARRSEGDKHVG